MTLGDLNRADHAAASASLLRCCGARRWVESMLAGRPFCSTGALFALADSAWWALPPDDWLEAFAAHPKIGEKKHVSAWSTQEQSGTSAASKNTLERLAAKNDEYVRQFGWIFLINATGKTAGQMLAALESRLENSRDKELRVAAREQAQITGLRLLKLLNE